MSNAGGTKKRNLRTGTSLWLDSWGLGLPVRPLRDALSVDVAIVGAGISGAFMANALSKDRSVAVLDRRPPLLGSTIASTALLQWEIDAPLTMLAKRIGPDKAGRAYLRSRSAVDALMRIVSEERIVCGVKAKSSLYLAGDEYGHRALEAEAEARAALGLDSRYIGPSELRERFDLGRTGAIVSSGSASGDPARLATGLLRRAQSRGARILSPVEVTQAISDPEGVTLLTDVGPAVRARAVVFCTGYEFLDDVSTEGARVVSTWAMASKPRQRCPAWLREMLVWEASDPYLYLRMTREGRLIVGGEDEDSGAAHQDLDKLHRKCAALTAKLKALLPGIEFELDYGWAGAFGASDTGLPTIGRVQGLDHTWAVMGFGGNGITYSVIASEIVAAEVRGGSDPDADLYRP